MAATGTEYVTLEQLKDLVTNRHEITISQTYKESGSKKIQPNSYNYFDVEEPENAVGIKAIVPYDPYGKPVEGVVIQYVATKSNGLSVGFYNLNPSEVQMYIVVRFYVIN